MIDADPDVRGRLKIVYLEEYNVSMSERLMPASEVSEQISLAGTEASGTGNMKLMQNGAITLGTMDGANVEIAEQVGPENILIFGMSTPEVEEMKQRGYRPADAIARSGELQRLLEFMEKHCKTGSVLWTSGEILLRYCKDKLGIRNNYHSRQ